jgi:tetratricopeptide (TPR) repeat protein
MDLDLNDNSKVHYELGQSELKHNNFLQALSHFNAGIKIQPENRILNLLCGYCLFNLKKFSEAENSFIKSISLAPNSDFIYSDILRIYQEVNKTVECIKLFSQCVKIFPQKSSLYFCLGDLFRGQEDYANALVNYYKVLELRNTESDIVALKNAKLFDRIAISKVELRNKTQKYLNTLKTDISVSEGRKIFEYEYSIPESMLLFPNQRRIFEFGKYMGYTINEVLTKNPEYISWCIVKIKHFSTSEEIIEMLRRANLISSTAIEMNFLKLKLKEANRGEYSPNPDPEIDYKNFDYDEEEGPQTVFEFSYDSAAQLYRKWYISGKKDKNSFFDNEQEDDMIHYLREELKDAIKYLSSYNDHKFFRFEIPFLIIDKKSLRQISVDLFFTDTDVTCINVPGCSAIGITNEEKALNILQALIEATDFRIKTGLSLMNRVIPMENPDNEHLRFMILASTKSIKSIQLIENLKMDGWNLMNEYKYNVVLGKETSKSVFTIPKVEMIPQSTNGWFELLRMFGTRRIKSNNKENGFEKYLA